MWTAIEKQAMDKQNEIDFLKYQVVSEEKEV